MKITKTSILSNKTNTLDIQVSQDQITSWQNGELIQNAMPGVIRGRPRISYDWYYSGRMGG